MRSLRHMRLTVSDLKRSVEFYQALLGLPVQHRDETRIGLRIGAGPQYLELAQTAPNARPGIEQFSMTVAKFNIPAITNSLATHGVTQAGPGPMKTWVKMRGPEAGGAPNGTPELYVGDPDGIQFQLQDPSYCGGGGPLGNLCKPLEPVRRKGLLQVRDISHFTLDVLDPQRASFYQDVFAMPVLNRQGPNGIGMAVGSKRQFVFLNSSGRRPLVINHACLTMQGFDLEATLKKLAQFGIQPRESATTPLRPLISYVTMRMEDRGGAKGGTPELYFTDPDGILIQLQDTGYCGGAGYLGNVCG